MIRTNRRAALYARFSSDNQRTESIDAQVRAMTEYCKRNNIIIVKTYVDEAKSAMTDRRPSFQQMIADSNLNIFDIVLVHKLDRFARNRYDSAIYKRELKKNNVAVFSVLENLDDSPESIMLEAVLEGLSEFYSKNLGREVMKGMKENALQTKHTGGIPPLGFDLDKETRKLTINEKEAETVRIIFDMYSKGYGYSPILEELHRQNRKTKTGKDFLKNSLYGILTNPKYTGTYVFNRSSAKSISGTRNTHKFKDYEDLIIVEGGCPQIISKDIYDQVQQRITENKHKGAQNIAKMNYLLSGTLFCKECGRAMVGNTRHSGRNQLQYVTYRCPSKHYNCNNKEINKDYLERYVVDLLEKEIFSASAMKRITKRIEANQNISTENMQENNNRIAEALSQTEEAITNVANAIANGLISEALTEKLKSLEAEKQRFLTELEASKRTAPNVPQIDGQLILSTYKELKNKPSSPEYKVFIQSFIDKIIVGRYMVDITIKTGLDVFPELDSTYSIKRQVIYEERTKQYKERGVYI